ncbi:aminotransferase-like domain-containing protein [Streptomyces yaizuensis]|uniref:PLP-dependent aminotransferase family protein n=1 Tax=Streptomyces yaizuensis TaxID=2989713 RepID=A0ABQ5NRP3_9ACTN|nr:PLP-dependent aminotransferase family protein [Streptomyces sp. YSPA8]GLF92840.1 PLP-dependent aminotransferase family protein [Streptomyces sp. YSPA8]
MAGLRPSPIAQALGMAARGGTVSLAAGAPAAEALPDDETRSLLDGVLSRPGALQYGETAGLPALREWIATDTARRTGRPVTARQVVVVHGSQQGFDLVCRAVLEPGDTVLVDRPSYSGVLQLLGLHRARVIDVPIAADPELTALDRALAREPVRMIYTVPTYANPTGDTLSRLQRAVLARLADRHGVLVVEDDPYRDLGFTPGAADLPPVAAGCDRVVTLGSFSKTLSPAARTGYVVVPEALATPLHRLKEAADLGNSTLSQLLVHSMVSDPARLAHRLERLRRIYRERRDILDDALRTHLGDELTYQRPGGGFFVWARLADGRDAGALLSDAVAEGVAYVPGAAFYARDPDPATLRLSYSAPSRDQLAKGCSRLARALCRSRTAVPRGTG